MWKFYFAVKTNFRMLYQNFRIGFCGWEVHFRQQLRCNACLVLLLPFILVHFSAWLPDSDNMGTNWEMFVPQVNSSSLLVLQITVTPGSAFGLLYAEVLRCPEWCRQSCSRISFEASEGGHLWNNSWGWNCLQWVSSGSALPRARSQQHCGRCDRP